MFEIFYFPIESDPGYFAPNRAPCLRGNVERNIPISNFVGNLIIGKISPGSSIEENREKIVIRIDLPDGLKNK